MAGDGRIFGTSSEVNRLSETVNLCMQGIAAANERGKRLLSTIEGSMDDAAYQVAMEIVSYVAYAVDKGQEPLEKVTKALAAYADFLDNHGK